VAAAPAGEVVVGSSISPRLGPSQPTCAQYHTGIPLTVSTGQNVSSRGRVGLQRRPADDHRLDDQPAGATATTNCLRRDGRGSRSRATPSSARRRARSLRAGSRPRYPTRRRMRPNTCLIYRTSRCSTRRQTRRSCGPRGRRRGPLGGLLWRRQRQRGLTGSDVSCCSVWWWAAPADCGFSIGRSGVDSGSEPQRFDHRLGYDLAAARVGGTPVSFVRRCPPGSRRRRRAAGPASVIRPDLRAPQPDDHRAVTYGDGAHRSDAQQCDLVIEFDAARSRWGMSGWVPAAGSRSAPPWSIRARRLLRLTHPRPAARRSCRKAPRLVVLLDLTVRPDAGWGCADQLRADVRDAQTWSLTPWRTERRKS